MADACFVRREPLPDASAEWPCQQVYDNSLPDAVQHAHCHAEWAHKMKLQSCSKHTSGSSQHHQPLVSCRAKQRIWDPGVERKAGLSGDPGQRYFPVSTHLKRSRLLRELTPSPCRHKLPRSCFSGGAETHLLMITKCIVEPRLPHQLTWMSGCRREVWLAPGVGDNDEGAGPADQGRQLRAAHLQPQGRPGQPRVPCEPTSMTTSGCAY